MKKQIIGPKHSGIARTPVVMQMEMLECGAACLDMILAYYGKWIPLEQMREDCGVSRDGSSAKNILRAARNHGLQAKAYRYEPETLLQDGSFPCIIHWNLNHFVVLKGFRGGKAYINDPARGSCTVTMDEFDTAFTGICLVFQPTEEFQPQGKPKSVLRFAQRRLRGAAGGLTFVVFATAIASIFTMTQPMFSRVLMDRLLGGQNPGWTVPFFLVFALFGILQLAIGWLQAIALLKLNGKLAAVSSTGYLWHVLHLPMSFFSQRMAGDIQQRQNDNAAIAKTLVETLAPLALQSFLMAFYLVLMLWYNWMLALVGLGALVLQWSLSAILSRKRVNITRRQQRSAGNLAGETVSAIQAIESIKASGAENGTFSKWAGYQASVNTGTAEYCQLNQGLGVWPGLIGAFVNQLVLVLGVWLVLRGEFTSGMVLAMQGFFNAFFSPAEKLIAAGQTLQEMRTQMERVEDVMEYPASSVSDSGNTSDAVEYDKLLGCVEVKNVTFGYSHLDEPLLKEFNLSLKTGSRVALVGASGCGKSTITKLLAGLYQPWSGTILYDGKPISDIDHSVFTGSVAVVDQDIVLFEDTIQNNIKLWDSSIEDFEMIMAARDAQIHEDIMRRDGGYAGVIAEGGRNLSGGQRQRLEIARVLAQDPTILILDEATSALDAETEYRVMQAIKNRGITCIVVAHRLSTIRDCDEILVLEHGRVVERGTHQQLYEKGGIYTQLITNE